MAESVELKPCPLCGHPAFLSGGEEEGLPTTVVCPAEDCGMTGPLRHTRSEAIIAWNRRVSASPAPEGGEEGEGSSRERGQDLCADGAPNPVLTADAASPALVDARKFVNHFYSEMTVSEKRWLVRKYDLPDNPDKPDRERWTDALVAARERNLLVPMARDMGLLPALPTPTTQEAGHE